MVGGHAEVGRLLWRSRCLGASASVFRSPPHANGDATGTTNGSTSTGNSHGGSASGNRAHPGPKAGWVRQVGGG